MNVTAITRFKHGNLHALLKKLGWTQSELARRAKIHPSTLGLLINLQQRPTAFLANKLQAAFGEAGEFLDVLLEWPDIFIPLKRGYKIEQTQDVETCQLESCPEAFQLEAPDDIQALDNAEAIDLVFTSLTPQQHYVIDSYFYDHITGTAIAKNIKVSKERVRQIKEKALRKMRTQIHKIS